jgi:DNA-binding transcriptional MerR regulator
MDKKSTIKQISALTGLSPHTLRYYEKEGLIKGVGRDRNNNRVYSEKDVEWLKFLQRLRSTGMSIQNMREYARLRDEGDHTFLARKRLLERHREEILRHMDELKSNLTAIETKIRFYEEVEVKIADGEFKV